MTRSLFIFLFFFFWTYCTRISTEKSLLLTPILPFCMVVPESNIANIHSFYKPMNPNIENTKVRPDNTALSIQ